MDADPITENVLLLMALSAAVRVLGPDDVAPRSLCGRLLGSLRIGHALTIWATDTRQAFRTSEVRRVLLCPGTIWVQTVNSLYRLDTDPERSRPERACVEHDDPREAPADPRFGLRTGMQGFGASVAVVLYRCAAPPPCPAPVT